MRPTLEALGIVHHTLTEESTLRFVVDSSIKQAFYDAGAGRLHPVAASDRRQSGCARTTHMRGIPRD